MLVTKADPAGHRCAVIDPGDQPGTPARRCTGWPAQGTWSRSASTVMAFWATRARGAHAAGPGAPLDPGGSGPVWLPGLEPGQGRVARVHLPVTVPGHGCAGGAARGIGEREERTG